MCASCVELVTFDQLRQRYPQLEQHRIAPSGGAFCRAERLKGGGAAGTYAMPRPMAPTGEKHFFGFYLTQRRLLLAEAKAVTARKLYLRVMPEFTVSGYARRRQRLCWNSITRWKAPRWKSTAKRAKRSWSSRITSRRWNIPPQGIVSAWSSACLPHRS